MNYGNTYLSPFGRMFLRSDGEVLTGLWFEGSTDEAKHPEPAEEKTLKVFDDTRHWLDCYFNGEHPTSLPDFRLLNTTPFRSEVSRLMCRIPYGTTVTYGDIAAQLAKERGLPRMSAQAVGGAVGWNPICIIIPCHRVIGANGNLTGYGGGIDHKIALLKLEGINTDHLWIKH